MRAREGRLRADYRTDARSTVITAVDIRRVPRRPQLRGGTGSARSATARTVIHCQPTTIATR